jgi:hypothetical protein
MIPPTEQLIRDYLNRLSLAAKIRLEPGDRQGLLDHTRARIDAECGGITNPSAARVRRTLAGLGDPMALVEMERSRAAARKARDQRAAPRGTPDVGPPAGKDPAAESQPAKKQESRFESRASGSLRQVWPPPASPVRAQRSLMPPVILPPVILPLATANVQVSAVRPATAATPPAPAVPCEPGNPLVLASAAAADDAPDGAKPARPTSPTEPRGLPPAKGVPRPRGVPPGGNASASGAEPAPPGGAGRGSGSNSGSNGLSSRPPAPRPAPESAVPPSAQPARAGAAGSDKPDQEPGQQRRSDAASGGQPDGDVPGVELSIDPVEFETNRMADVGDALVRRLRGFGKALLTIALRDRLEAISLLLLGIGGAFYPPIWLIGAAVAVASRKWDLRDKWIGLVLPVLVVILGATLTVTFGTQQTSYMSYLVEGWVAASRLSRVAAVLGAIYLLWRVYKYGGRRSRRLPPWSPQRKPGR